MYSCVKKVEIFCIQIWGDITAKYKVCVVNKVEHIGSIR